MDLQGMKQTNQNKQNKYNSAAYVWSACFCILLLLLYRVLRLLYVCVFWCHLA